MRQPTVAVAAVDGVCLFIPRAVLTEVGGFDESDGFTATIATCRSPSRRRAGAAWW